MNSRPQLVRPAFMAIDMLFGILIVSTLSITLLSAVRRENNAEIELSASRSAIHLAEHALLNLQHNQPPPKSIDQAKLEISPVTDSKAPAGLIWIKVKATIQKHTRSLIGIVPADSIYSGEKLP